MAAVIVVLDICAHTLGLLNLFLLALLYARDRDSLYLREFLLMGSFSLIVIHQSLQAALGSDLPPLLSQAGGTLAMTGVSLMIFALPWYVNHLEPDGFARLDDRFFGFAGLLALVANLASEFGWRMGFSGWREVNDGVARATMVVCVVAIAYTLYLAVASSAMVVLQKRRAPKAGGTAAQTHPPPPLNDTTRMAMRMGLFTLLLMPVLLWLDFAGQTLPGLERFKVLPVEYLLWSALLMSLRVRTILAVPRADSCVESDALGPFCRACDISPREQEVLEGLVCGRTYEQIADGLCISLSTVKTHVGKIYRKTGVANKVELIHRMRQG